MSIHYYLNEILLEKVSSRNEELRKTIVEHEECEKILIKDLKYEKAIKRAFTQTNKFLTHAPYIYLLPKYIDYDVFGVSYKEFTELVHAILEEVDKECVDTERIYISSFEQPRLLENTLVSMTCHIKFPHGSTLRLFGNSSLEAAKCKFEYTTKTVTTEQQIITSVICEEEELS